MLVKIIPSRPCREKQGRKDNTMGQNKATDAAMSKRLISYTEAILGVGEKSQSPEDLVIEPTAEEARLILERFFRA